MKLEFKYGPLPGFTPALDDVLDYLKPVSQKKEFVNDNYYPIRMLQVTSTSTQCCHQALAIFLLRSDYV